MAYWNMRWLVDSFPLGQVERVYLIHGTTSAHTFDGSSEVIVADMLKQHYSPSGPDVRALNHLLLEVDGTLHDFAHHGPPPSKKLHLENRAQLSYLSDMVTRCVFAGIPWSDVTYRGHWHRILPPATHHFFYHGEANSVWFLQCPAYCRLSPYARKVSQSEFLLATGSWGVHIEQGQVNMVRPFMRMTEVRTKEEWK
jgi:hypothetical protein